MHDPAVMPRRLASFLSQHDGGRTATVVAYDTMVGGYSRLMARADIEWSDGTVETLVLRGDPPAGKAMMETDRDTEYALLRVLGDTGAITMPRARHYDRSGDHLGTKCIVLDHVAGSSLQTVLNEAPADRRRRHADDLVDTLARIHSIDVDSLAMRCRGHRVGTTTSAS